MEFKSLNCQKILADRVAYYVQAYTLYSSVRPFGISAILAVVDNDGPGLYMIEPSGVYYVKQKQDYQGTWTLNVC